jgi:prepilin-type N-terminal cleavage/methylation domain-containing protein
MLIRQPEPARGFTLVEILVVVVILGIASMVILPQLGDRGDLEAAAAARVITADLTYAQNLAIVKQRKHYVRFEGQSYSLWTRDDGGTLVRVKHPVRREDFIVTLGSSGASGLRNVSLSSVSLGGSGYDAVGFDELGSPISANLASGANVPLASRASCTINAGSHRLTVFVEPFTGEVTIE